MSKKAVRMKPATASLQRLKLSDLFQTKPAINLIIPIQTDVSIVQTPAPKGLVKSPSVMLRKPTPNPAIGPATIPPTITKKATGLMFGGPPARTNRKATLQADRHAIRAKVSVLLGICLLPTRIAQLEDLC